MLEKFRKSKSAHSIVCSILLLVMLFSTLPGSVGCESAKTKGSAKLKAKVSEEGCTWSAEAEVGISF